MCDIIWHEPWHLSDLDPSRAAGGVSWRAVVPVAASAPAAACAAPRRCARSRAGVSPHTERREQ